MATARRSRVGHPAIVDHAVAYFVFSFAATEPLDIRRVAEDLLQADLAETASSPASNEVRVAHRYHDLVRLTAKAKQVQGLAADMRRPFPAFARRHPLVAVRSLASVLRHSKGTRTAEPSDDAEQTGDTVQDMQETIDMIARSVAEQQATLAIQHEIETDLFRPQYLESEPYLRLELRGTGQWFNLLTGGTPRPTGDMAEGIFCNALLLVHRSGVLQLTLALALPEKLDTDAVLPLLFAGSPCLTASRIPEPLIAQAGKAWDAPPESRWLGEWLPEVQSGVRWREMAFDDPSSVRDLFALYRDAITATARIDIEDEWFCYPAIFVDGVGCCFEEETWRRNHSLELAALASRMSNYRDLRPVAAEDLIPTDTALLRDHSVFFSIALVLVIQWGQPASNRDFADHLYTLLLAEAALLQYWQLRSLQNRFAVTEGNPAGLRRVQRELLYGLAEYRQSALTYGSAQDVLEPLLSGWRVDMLHDRLLEAVDQVQQVAAADEARRAARRSSTLAAVAVLATLVFGLPAMKQSIDVASDVPRHGFLGWLAAPLVAAHNHGATGTWVAYLIVVLATVVLLMLRLPPRRPRGRRGSAPPGIAWPGGTVRVVRDTSSEVAPSPEEADPRNE